jgi:glycosyltransferase involved in cell wall biosynthesis
LQAAPDLSVVIPCFNEEDSILPLAQALHESLSPMRRSFEVIFVDDGSTDATAKRIDEVLALDRRVRAVHLVENAGQTAALCAGIDFARGRYVIALDADLQNDPADIPAIVGELDAGYDVVSGWRRDRKDRFFSRRLPSIVANSILSLVSGVRLHDFGCTLKGYRTQFLRRVPLYSDMHRYVPAFAAALGAKVKEVVVRHHPRRFGRSKYGIERIYRVMLDILVLQLLVHFAMRPLHWFGRVSLWVFLLVGGLLLGVMLGKHDPKDLEDSPLSTIVIPGMTGLGVYLGVTVLSLGFLCELLNRVGDAGMDHLYTQHDVTGHDAPRRPREESPA